MWKWNQILTLFNSLRVFVLTQQLIKTMFGRVLDSIKCWSKVFNCNVQKSRTRDFSSQPWGLTSNRPNSNYVCSFLLNHSNPFYSLNCHDLTSPGQAMKKIRHFESLYKLVFEIKTNNLFFLKSMLDKKNEYV